MQGNPTLVEVMSYLPPAMGSDQLMMESQNTNDLAKAIAKSHQDNLKYAKKIAFLFRGYDDQETARNIFNFIKKYIPYTIEPGERQCTKTLPRMLDDARNGIGSDCKMYSVLTGTILKTLKIPFKYRLAGYSTNYPQHIYCKTDKYTIDAVLPHFNYEKPYNYKKDMALYNLAGTDQIGKWTPKTEFGKKIRKATDKLQAAGEKAKDAVKGAAKQYIKGAKIVGAAIPRQAFLGLVSLNGFGWANRMDRLRKKNQAALVDLWQKKFGGEMSAINRAIDDGIKKKPLFKKGQVSGVDQIGVCADPFSCALELLAAATPIIIVAIQTMKKNNVPDSDLPPIEIPPPPPGDPNPGGDTYVDKSAEGENTPMQPMPDDKADAIAEKVANAETGTGTTVSKINPLVIVGVGAVALLLLTKKK